MFQSLIKKIGGSFQRANIPYMLIGGQAVLFYGEPRLTKDIDITLGLGVEGLDNVLSLVARLGLKPLVSDIESFVKETMVLPVVHDKSGIRVDLIFSYTPYERQAIERAVTVKLGRTNVQIAALEDIIIHKMIAGRPRDHEDVRMIILKNPRYDTEYIAKWLVEFGSAAGQDFVAALKKLTSRPEGN